MYLLDMLAFPSTTTISTEQPCNVIYYYGKIPLKNLKCRNLKAMYIVVENTRYLPTKVSNISIVLRVVPTTSPNTFTTNPTFFCTLFALENFFRLEPINLAGNPTISYVI